MLKSNAITIASGGHEFFLHYNTAAGDAGFSPSFPKGSALTLGRKGGVHMDKPMPSWQSCMLRVPWAATSLQDQHSVISFQHNPLICLREHFHARMCS